MKKSKICVRPSTESDYKQIAQLLDGTFGPKPYEKRLKLWKWRHQDNPTRIAEIPPFIVGDVDGVIVGVHGLIPLRVKISSKTYVVACSCDFAVDPDYRSAGLKIKIRAMKKEMTQIPMSTSANGAANKITIALGGKELVAAKNKYLKYMKLSGILGHRIGRVAQVAAIPLDWFFGFKTTAINSGSAALRNIIEFDSHFDRFWDVIAGQGQNMFVRDSSYLNWRYLLYPFSGIEAFGLFRGDRVDGYAVLHKYVDKAGLPATAILELMTELGDSASTRLLLAEALNRAFDHESDTVSAITNDSTTLEALEIAGFRRRERATSPYTYQNQTSLEDELFDRGSNWHIALGDGDASYYFD